MLGWWIKEVSDTLLALPIHILKDHQLALLIDLWMESRLLGLLIFLFLCRLLSLKSLCHADCLWIAPTNIDRWEWWSDHSKLHLLLFVHMFVKHVEFDLPLFFHHSHVPQELLRAPSSLHRCMFTLIQWRFRDEFGLKGTFRVQLLLFTQVVRPVDLLTALDLDLMLFVKTFMKLTCRGLGEHGLLEEGLVDLWSWN